MKKGGLLLLLGLTGLGLALYVGLYQEREHLTYHLFLKHRPTFKFYFHAPQGEADYKEDKLTPQERFETEMYREFVEKNNGWRRSVCVWWF